MSNLSCTLARQIIFSRYSGRKFNYWQDRNYTKNSEETCFATDSDFLRNIHCSQLVFGVRQSLGLFVIKDMLITNKNNLFILSKH